MRVHWTHTAIAHLLAIYEHIARDASIYAQRIVDRLTRRSEQIATFPQSGRMVPEYGAPDIREVIERPYRIIYRIQEDQIDVLAVRRRTCERCHRGRIAANGFHSADLHQGNVTCGVGSLERENEYGRGDGSTLLPEGKGRPRP